MSQNRSTDRPKPAATLSAQQQREQRLAAALRENLKKRKAQARDQARDQMGDRARPAENSPPAAGDKLDRG
jgi:hypothetical protein